MGDLRPAQADSLNRETLDRLGIDGLWPLRPGRWDEDTFYSLVEVVHDLVVRGCSPFGNGSDASTGHRRSSRRR